MKTYFRSVGLVIALTCGICWLNSATAQEQSRSSASSRASSSSRASETSRAFGNSDGTGALNGNFRRFPGMGMATGNQQSNGQVSGSRSVSFTKNGKRISIKEDDSGITVTVDGKTVRAKDATELKHYFPEAHRLYEDHIGAARFGGSAGGSSGSSAGGFLGGSSGGNSRSSSGGFAGGNAAGFPRGLADGFPRGAFDAMGGPGQFKSNSSSSRSFSTMENGHKVTITENKSGITVDVNGQTVRASNVDELRTNFPDAYQLYERHMRRGIGANNRMDARSLMQSELLKMRDKNAANPQLRSMIERMMRNNDQ